MTSSLFDVGDLVEVSAVFTNLAGAATNPTAVTLTVRDPAGVSSTVTATNDPLAVGRFTGLISPTLSGLWYYRFAGVGAVTAAEEKAFLVRTRRVP